MLLRLRLGLWVSHMCFSHHVYFCRTLILTNTLECYKIDQFFKLRLFRLPLQRGLVDHFTCVDRCINFCKGTLEKELKKLTDYKTTLAFYQQFFILLIIQIGQGFVKKMAHSRSIYLEISQKKVNMLCKLLDNTHPSTPTWFIVPVKKKKFPFQVVHVSDMSACILVPLKLKKGKKKHEWFYSFQQYQIQLQRLLSKKQIAYIWSKTEVKKLKVCLSTNLRIWLTSGSPFKTHCEILRTMMNFILNHVTAPGI